MTGFGAASATTSRHRVELELRSVNHRFFEFRARTEGAYADIAAGLEAPLRARLERGRVDATLRIETLDPNELDARLEAAVRRVAALRDRVAKGEPLPWQLALELAGRDARADGRDEALEACVANLADVAASALTAARAKEGAALRVELERLLDELEHDARAIDDAVPQLVERQREKLAKRVATLLRGQESRVDPSRLEFEIAMLADKLDVTEELARLSVHVTAFRDLLAASGPVGRKLDFTTQELLRETNTLGSKVPDAAVAQRVVSMKTTLERAREQVQNVL